MIPKRIDPWKAGAWLVTASYLAFSLTTLSSYGIFLDQPSGLQRGGWTIVLVRSLFNGNHVQRANAVFHLSALRHPPLFSVLQVLTARALPSQMNFVDVIHLPIVLSAAVGLMALFFLGRTLFGSRIGFFSVAMLALMPRFVGYAQIDPKDIPAAAAATVSMIFVWKVIRTRRVRSAVEAGFFIGVAAACGLFTLIVPVLLAIGLLIPAEPGFVTSRDSKLFGIALLVAGATLFAFWPILWVDPLYFWQTAVFFTGKFWGFTEVYLGKTYPGDQMPWHYSLVHLALSTPSLIVVLAIAGIAASMGSRVVGRARAGSVLMIAWFFIPLAIECLPGLSRYEGMRHLIIILPPMAVFAAVGLVSLLDAVSSDRRWVFALAAFLVAGDLASEIAEVHPNEDSYFNEVARAAFGDHLQRMLRTGSSLTAYRAAFDWINENAEGGARIGCNEEAVAACYPLRPDLALSTDAVDYYVARSYGNRRRYSGGRDVVFETDLYGRDIVQITRFAHRTRIEDYLKTLEHPNPRNAASVPREPSLESGSRAT